MENQRLKAQLLAAADLLEKGFWPSVALVSSQVDITLEEAQYLKDAMANAHQGGSHGEIGKNI